MLTYACQYGRQRTVRQRLRNFCINENKMISREDRMLIKVLHQEKSPRKLLAEFPNKAFELIPTVLETCVFSVSS